MKLSPCRLVAGLAGGGVALTACSSSGSSGSTAARPRRRGTTAATTAAAAPTCSHGHAEAAGLDRADERHGPVDQGLPDRLHRRDDQLQRRPAPAPVSPTSSPSRTTSSAPTRRWTRPRASRQGRRPPAASPPLDLPMVVGPIAVAYKLNGVTNLTLDGPTDRQDLPGQDHDLERPGDQGAQLRRQPAVDQDHRRSTARDSSGTTQNFERYLAATAPTDFTSTPDKDSSKAGFAGQGKARSQGVAAGHQPAPRAPSATTSAPSR